MKTTEPPSSWHFIVCIPSFFIRKKRERTLTFDAEADHIHYILIQLPSFLPALLTANDLLESVQANFDVVWQFHCFICEKEKKFDAVHRSETVHARSWKRSRLYVSSFFMFYYTRSERSETQTTVKLMVQKVKSKTYEKRLSDITWNIESSVSKSYGCISLIEPR